MGTAVTYHLINRLVSIFLVATPMPVPGSRPGLRRMAARVFGASIGRNIVARVPVAGESLHYLPAADLPDDLSWAGENPYVADAFAGCVALVESAGERALSSTVRGALLGALELWWGEAKGLDRSWLDAAVRHLEAKDRPAARLVYLSAFAPHQVDAGIVAAYREQHPCDADLLAATTWAGFAAARRIGSWLAGGDNG